MLNTSVTKKYTLKVVFVYDKEETISKFLDDLIFLKKADIPI